MPHNALARYHGPARRTVAAAVIRGAGHVARRYGGTLLKAARKSFAHKVHKKSGKQSKRVMTVAAPADSHSGLVTNTVKVGSFKKAKLLKGQKTVGRWRYQQDNKMFLLGTAGGQTVTVVASANTIAKVLTSSGAGYDATQGYTALYRMNPYEGNTGSANLPSLISQLQDRFIMLSVCFELEFTSLGAVGTYCDVYVCRAKKANSVGPIQCWQQGYVDAGFTVAGFSAPGPGSSTGVLGVQSPFMAHTKPNDVRLFRDFWKIEKVVPLAFTGNGSERLNIDVGINKVIKVQDYQRYLSSGNNYAPGSYVVFAVTRGGIVVDNTNTGVGEVPTYGTTRLGLIVQEKTTMCGVMGNSGRLDSNLGYSNVSISVPQSAELFVNEVDQPVTVASGTVQ